MYTDLANAGSEESAAVVSVCIRVTLQSLLNALSSWSAEELGCTGVCGAADSGVLRLVDLPDELLSLGRGFWF